MARRYVHPNTGKSLQWPDTRQAARENGFKRYNDGSICSVCNTQSSRYTETNYCYKCQFHKCIALHALKHADHLWNHSELTCEVEYKAAPHKFSDDVYMELIEMKWRMDDDKSLVAHAIPCKDAGHLHVARGGKCLTCLELKSARRVAKANGDYSYTGKPCNTCESTDRITSTSLCVKCHGRKEKQVSARQHAINEGKDWYTPDKPCKNCNTVSLKRVNNGQCQGCQPVAKFSEESRAQATINNKANYIGEECTECCTDIRVTSTGACARCSI